MSLDEHVVVGMEALLRWDHPERGSLKASEFLPVADGAGLSVAIGTWALGEAFRQAAEWQVGEHLRMHVNVSARQLGPELVPLVRGALAVSGADPGGICLEFAETALMAEVSMVSLVLRDLKELGACLSIDDFRTGTSRLAEVGALLLDEVKIDRSLTKRLGGGERERIVTAMGAVGARPGPARRRRGSGEPCAGSAASTDGMRYWPRSPQPPRPTRRGAVRKRMSLEGRRP